MEGDILLRQVERLLSGLVKEGVFGPDQSYLGLERNGDEKKGEGYAARVNFFKLHLKALEANCSLSIVVKQPHLQDVLREVFNSDVQFNNEVLMLKDVLPRLGEGIMSCFPKLYFGMASQGTSGSDVVVMEDLREKGFQASKDILHLDHSHITLAIRKLGEFHGTMFKYKVSNEKEFSLLADRLIQHKLDYDEKQDYWEMIRTSMMRGIEPLIDSGVEVEVLRKLIGKLKNTKNLTAQLIQPDDPFGLIIHGDFNRNNIMFKYDENNKPVDVVFLDLQDSAFSNIIVDLSFFLYMHTSPSSREAHWDSFLEDYYRSFSRACDFVGPTFEEFLDYFSKKALYGYLPTSFFAPVMLMISRGEKYWIVDETTEEVNLLQSNNSAEIGGEDGTELLKSIVMHLLERRYLQSFLGLV